MIFVGIFYFFDSQSHVQLIGMKLCVDFDLLIIKIHYYVAVFFVFESNLNVMFYFLDQKD